MSKRGAVTGYIIVGLVLLILLAVSLYVKQLYLTTAGLPTTTTQEIAAEAKPVQLFVEQCLHNTVQQAVIIVGKQGGYYHVPVLSIEHEHHRVPYYFYLTNDTSVKNKHSIENEIADFIVDTIPQCLQRFASFPYKVKTETESPVVQTTTIDNTKVTVRMIMPTVITRDNTQYRLDTFDGSVAVNLGKLYGFSKQIIQQHTQDPTYIPVGMLTDLAYENTFTYKLVQYNASFVYRFIDNTTMFSQQPYEFDFGVKYNW